MRIQCLYSVVERIQVKEMSRVVINISSYITYGWKERDVKELSTNYLESLFLNRYRSADHRTKYSRIIRRTADTRKMRSIFFCV